LDKDKPGIVAVSVDLHRADKKKINHYNDLIADRKPDQYSR
jgi:hypothetical protein